MDHQKRFGHRIKLRLWLMLLLLFPTLVHGQSIFRTVCQGNLSRLDSLLEQEPLDTLDGRGRSLLHWAAGCGQPEAFEYLLEKGLPLNQTDNRGFMVLHQAMFRQSEPLFDRIVALQPDDSWKQKFGPGLLEKAIINRIELFALKLIALGVDVNAKNKRGNAPLQIATRMDQTAVATALIAAGADPNAVKASRLKGMYLGQKTPGSTAQVFAPNVISTEENEFGSVFNAAGNEFYFGVDVNGKSEISWSQLVNGTWTKPKVLLSHERYGYNDPFLSTDEQRLYFISGRALDGVGEAKDIDIWFVERQENSWSEPINAGPNINSERNEYYISFTQSDRLYFGTNALAPEDRKNNDYDICYSDLVDGTFQKPVVLGKTVNTEAYEADVFVAPDESYLIFCSTRENGVGQGDLYISFKDANDSWTTAINMGPSINTEAYEYCPFVTADGKFLFYTSNQDIYWISATVIEDLRGEASKR